MVYANICHNKQNTGQNITLTWSNSVQGGHI